MIATLRLPLLLALAAALPAAAQAPAGARFEIRPVGKGPQRLELPAAFLSASARGDLADLRLHDARGEEVPYLLVQPPAAEPPRWIGVVRVRPIPTTKVESGFEVDLGTVRTVRALELDLTDAGFLKKARLEGSADGQRWVVLAPDAVLYRLPLDPAACAGDPCPGALVRRELTFDPAAVRHLRVVLDDRRSPRLPPPAGARALLAPGDGPAAGPPVPLAVARGSSEPGASRFTLRLPGPHLPVRAVGLKVDAAQLARRARVLEARLVMGRLAPAELGSATLLQLSRDEVQVSALRVPIAPPEELELELAVEDGDNPPLALTAAWAELAPLPWIFFESPDGAPIEARLGEPALAAPRYDLEALRPRLEQLRPARATAAGEPRPGPGASAAAPAGVPEAAGAGAALDRKAFRFARAVEAGPPGLAAVRLDAEVLALSPSLADLRVAGADGRQLPYLLERREEPLSMRLEERPATAGDGAPRELSGPGLTLHELRAGAELLPAGQLVLETGARVFTRRVLVWARPEGRRDGAGALLGEATWAHANPDRPAPPLTLDLPRLAGERIVVAVNDGDNAPVPLSGARLVFPTYRLRFFHPGAPLTLLYGADLPAPQYDLALLAPRLRAAAAREVALAPGAGAAPDEAGPRGVRVAFWAVLGLAVLGLLALVARLLARGGDAR